MTPKKGNGERGPDRKPRKGSPRLGRKGVDQRQESPSRARREKALELLAAGNRVADVALAIGQHERAVYRLLADKAFAAELDARLDAARSTALRILRAGAEAAATSLVDMATNGSPEKGSRVAASTAILDRIGIPAKPEMKVEVSGGLYAKSEAELEAMVTKAAAGLKPTEGA